MTNTDLGKSASRHSISEEDKLKNGSNKNYTICFTAVNKQYYPHEVEIENKIAPKQSYQPMLESN
ncbi:hypothetical protein T01_7646 [Trichinella spiralis]|uniref:Uncharacterized protein n=1 Tax=Trichinella spiralis TaxID=6334 RepID=A0A0V1B7V3_TRISP|nr:hypothetical protein T01_7646 [Trichinella spiralis]